MHECKGCGIQVEEKDACMVAHWPFCKACFEALMAKSTPVEEPQVETVQCNLCHVEMKEGEGHTMLGLLFCDGCHHALTHRAPSAEPTLEEEVGAPAFKVAQVEVNTRETISCDGCGRMIPKLGAREREGDLLCPDCFYKEDGTQDNQIP